MHSLTQETTLREVDNLRQQIYRIKGGSSAVLSSPFRIDSSIADCTIEGSNCRSRHKIGFSSGTRGATHDDRSPCYQMGPAFLRNVCEKELACQRCLRGPCSPNARQISCRPEEKKEKTTGRQMRYNVT